MPISPATPAPSGEFRYLPTDSVVYGRGSLMKLPALVDRLGGQRAFIVTGRSLATQTGLVRQVEDLLGARHVGTYAEAGQHVPSQTVIAAANQARARGADLLISLGGGSPIDTTKLVAAALALGWADPAELGAGSPIRRSGLDLDRPPLPQIAIATTLSAGEFTPSAGVTDEASRVKGGLGDRRLAPAVVIHDPEATIPTPPRLWLSTGLKALDHAFERLYAPRRTPMTEALCPQAILLLWHNLPASAAADDAGLARRGHCQAGAWLSMWGNTNDGLGLSHAIGHQLGAGCGVPHGITSCITIPPVLRYIGQRQPDRLALIAAALGLDVPPERAGEAAAEAVAEFVHKLGLPGSLREAGVDEARIPVIAAATAHELQSPRHGTPSIDQAGLEGLLREMW